VISNLVNGVTLTTVDPATGEILWRSSGTTENFILIGHSLIALVLAWVGGHLSRWLHARSRPNEAWKERRHSKQEKEPGPMVDLGRLQLGSAGARREFAIGCPGAAREPTALCAPRGMFCKMP
jgi:hypothetical protein